MEYTVGSVADLISGKSTPNKVKIIKKEIKNTNLDYNQDSGSNEVVPIAKGGRKKFKKKKVKKETKDDDMVVITPEDVKTLDEAEQESGKSESSESEDEKESNPEEELDAAAKAEIETRTVFVGNVPVDTSRGKLLRFFRPFGRIQSVRLRGLAPENPMISRRTVAIKKLVHPKRSSMIAYVVFRKCEDSLKSLKLNGTKFGDHYLRVTRLLKDESRSAAKAIFIGQLDFEAEDNDLWEAFENCGAIESVRVVRDKFGVGTGIGYVNFNSADSVELALQMEDVKIKKRICRISRYNNPKDKKMKPNNKFAGNKKKEFKNFKRSDKFPKTEKNVTNVKKSVYRGRVVKKADQKKFNKGMAQKLKLAGKIAPK